MRDETAIFQHPTTKRQSANTVNFPNLGSVDADVICHFPPSYSGTTRQTVAAGTQQALSLPNGVSVSCFAVPRGGSDTNTGRACEIECDASGCHFDASDLDNKQSSTEPGFLGVTVLQPAISKTPVSGCPTATECPNEYTTDPNAAGLSLTTGDRVLTCAIGGTPT